MKEIHQQLSQIKNAWDAITTVPDDLTSLGFPSLTKQSIADALGGMAELSKQILEKDFSPLPTTKFNFLQILANLNAHITGLVSNPSAYIPGLLGQIEQIRTSLRYMLEEAEGQGRRVYGTTAERLAIAISKVSDASKIYDTIIKTRDATKAAAEQINSAANSAAQYANTISSLEEDAETQRTNINNVIQKITEETQEEIVYITEAKDEATENSDKITKMVSTFSTLESDLKTDKETLKNLFSEFEEYRSEAKSILEITNQASLAGSFIARKKQLKVSQFCWGTVFIISIIILTYMGFKIILPNLPTGTETTPSLDMWKAILQHLPLTAPVIWLGWFAARQYGFASRLGEDYAFKAATAMAFEGYKRQASEAGEKMSAKLLKTAINNFGENPIRIFKGHANHASPVHEIIDKTIVNKTKPNANE